MQESPSLDRGVLHSLHDLDNHLTRSAFPAEAVEEDTVVDDGAPAPFLILDTLESPEDLAIGLLPHDESPEQLETPDTQSSN